MQEPAIRVTLLGAAGEVTGSAYLVHTPRATLLVDFGMFQGRNGTDEKNAALGDLDPRTVDAVVLTHAHLDHCGRLPLLAQRGLAAPVWATPATIDVAELILRDAAHIQAMDAERDNRRRLRAGQDPLPPLYTEADVEAALGLLRPVPMHQPVEVAPGVRARFVDAGHILGSTSVELTIADGPRDRVIAFSGDVGQRGMPLLRDPEPLTRGDLVFLESTYGDRDHRPIEQTREEFRRILTHAADQRAKILIPAFAVGRTQQILYFLAELRRENAIPDLPIYLDSPMAIKATMLHRKHSHLYDADAAALAQANQFEKDLANVRPLLTGAESRQLNDSWDPAIIIAGSGMCDGGRIMHHLKHHLWRRGVAVIMTGYMGQGTLGRRLIDGAPEVRIHGDTVAVRATIHTLGGLSAHAGRTQLLEWLAHSAPSRPAVALTHGEDRQRESLRGAIRDRFGLDAVLPMLGDTIPLR